jgi:hypothetical protein
LNCGRIHADLIGSRIQKTLDVFGGANATPDGKRNKDLISYRLDHGQDQVAVAGGRRNIEKGEFVGAIKIVTTRNFHRVARVAKVDEIGALHYAPCINVKAGNDALS